ncbi:MAG TPA: hypothetical protein VGO93_07105 [Candidatus Xenobia bacterium]
MTRGWVAAALYGVILAALLAWPRPRPALPPPRPPAVAVTPPSPSPSPQWMVGRIPGVDVADLETELQRIRGLSFVHKVPAAIQTREQLRQFLTHDPDEEPPAQEWATLRVFGLIPPKFDVQKFKLDLLTQQVGGYYDPRTRRFNVIEGNTGMSWLSQQLAGFIGYDVTSIVTIHEMDHALDDQHFDIRRMEERLAKAHDDDRTLGVQGLLEGDATWVMLDYALQHMPMGVSLDTMSEEQMDFTMRQASGQAVDALKSIDGQAVPLVYTRMLIFPYFTGMRFIHHLYRLGGWPLVNLAWSDPPDTTQQLMHPERYSGTRAFPLELHWKPAAGVFKENTLGEFLITVFLEQHLHDAMDDVAQHWDGDRYRIFKHGGRLSLWWMTAWDDAVAARRFETAVRTAFKTMPNRLPGAWKVERRGLRVGVMYGGAGPGMWSATARRPTHATQVHLSEGGPSSIGQMLFGPHPSPDFVRRGPEWVSPGAKVAVRFPSGWDVASRGLPGHLLLRADGPRMVALLLWTVSAPDLGATLDMASGSFLDTAKRTGMGVETVHGETVQWAEYRGVARDWKAPARLRWLVVNRPGTALVLGMVWPEARQAQAVPLMRDIEQSLRPYAGK